MKITLSQQISLEDFRKGFVNIYKYFDSAVIPHKGDLITDSLYKDPNEHEVVEVVIDYQNNECLVRLEMIKLESNDSKDLKKFVDLAELHGWECAIKDVL